MNRRFARSSRRRAQGLTLVEALVGTAIMGTVLASILVAAGRLNAQSGRAGRRIEACAIADELLAEWWSDRKEFPREDDGDVAGREGWTWRTQRMQREDALELKTEVVAVEVFSPGPKNSPAARVEILLPVESHEQGQRPDTD